LDFNGPDYFPTEWESAEALYSRAQNGARATVGNVRQTTALFTSAAEAYEALVEPTIAAFAQDLEEQIMLVRGEVINGGAEDLVPSYLLRGDTLALQALDQYEAEDYYAAKDSGLLALDVYTGIAVGLDAYYIRQEAVDKGIVRLAPEYLWSADDFALGALAQFEAGNYGGALDTALAAQDAYKTIVLGLDTYYIREIAIAEGIEQIAPEYLWGTDDVALDALGYFERGYYSDAYGLGLQLNDAYKTMVVGLEAYKFREEAIAKNIEGLAPEYLWKADDAALNALAEYEARNVTVALEESLLLRDAYRTMVAGLDTYYVREKAIALGIEGIIPEGPLYLNGTDDVALQALGYYERGYYNNAYGLALLLQDAYGVMVVGLEAYSIRMEIEDGGFYPLDAENLDRADAIAFSALEDYENRNIASAAVKADDVLARYDRSLVATKGAHAAELGAVATVERSRAIQNKANVAAKEEYNAAETVFIQGVNAFNVRNFDLAASNYTQSRPMFTRATDVALQKRSLAEAAIRAAEARIEASDQAAYRAELLIGGGAR
jgi:hypothetical protein